ncbi:unnamed protein product [Prunus brigantina]
MIDFKLESLRKSSHVNQPCYGKTPVQEDKSESPDSPTQSDFLVDNFAINQVRTINRKFVINWKTLDKHLIAPKNQKRRESFHQAFPDKESSQQIFNEWKGYMRSTKVEIFYLDSHHLSKKLKTLTKEKWKLLSNTEVESSHPPVETFVFNYFNTQIQVSPFKALEKNDPDKRLVDQSNYTNRSLVVIGKQLDKIETKVGKFVPKDNKAKIRIEKPIIQFQDLKTSPTLKIKPTMKKIEEMLEQLTPDKAEKFGLKTLDSFTVANFSESEYETIGLETHNISKIENAFKNLEVKIEPRVKRLNSRINPTSLTKNWCPRPTPPDIQFE